MRWYVRIVFGLNTIYQVVIGLIALLAPLAMLGIYGATDADKQVIFLHAAMRGYVRFAAGHPHLFELMFSPSYPDFSDPALREKAADSYAILRDIATGLDWDKATTPDGQLKTEMMLWSLVHGYAILSLSGQFSRGEGCGPVYGIDEVMPDFGYRE